MRYYWFRNDARTSYVQGSEWITQYNEQRSSGLNQTWPGYCLL